MNSITVEREAKKQGHYEKLVQPETPEQPLIRVCRNIEKDCYEGVFALELVGIGRKKKKSTEQKSEDLQSFDFEQYKRLLLTGLSQGNGVDFVYTSGKNKNGKSYFRWRIIGQAQGGTEIEATESAQRLWRNLNVMTGTLKADYTFAPVAEAEKLDEEKGEKHWSGRLVRSGIAIKADSRIPMGFHRPQKTDRGSSVLMPAERASMPVSNFDSFALGAAGCEAEVRLVLSIRCMHLTAGEVKKVSSALEWIRNGEPKKIMYQAQAGEGCDDKDLLKNIEAGLDLWLRNPSGYQVTCRLASAQPIPAAFAGIVGNDLFQGGFSLISNDSDIRDARDIDNALDLRDCINSASSLPPFFPRVETLTACNVKRSFNSSMPDLQESGILLGMVGEKAVARPVRFNRGDRSRHAYVIGATGTGKSTLLYSMIRQDMENGEGVCLIDPHGDLFEQVLYAVPRERAEDVVIVDPSDFERSVGINFLETGDFNKSVQQNFVVNEMIKIFDRLYDLKTTGGPIFEQYMRNTMLLLMDNEYPYATLTDVPLVFEDKDYRNYLKKGCKNPIVESFWTKQAESAGGDASISNVAPYITSKLNQFIHNALLRPIIGQPKSTINFREIMDSGKILLVNLSKGMLGELDAQLLGMLLIGKLFSSAMGRITMPQEKRRNMFLYIDEFQNFTTDSVAYLLSESRKFGLALTLANQNLSQLTANNGNTKILDSVIGNVGSMMILRLGIMDSAVLKDYTKPELDEYDLNTLSDFHVAARLLTKNVPGKTYVFKTLAAKVPDDPELAAKIKVLSRLKHATDTKMVEAEIITRRTAYKKAKEQPAAGGAKDKPKKCLTCCRLIGCMLTRAMAEDCAGPFKDEEDSVAG